MIANESRGHAVSRGPLPTATGRDQEHSAVPATPAIVAAALETNTRWCGPTAGAGWGPRFRGIFRVRDGWMHADGLDGPGPCTG